MNTLRSNNSKKEKKSAGRRIQSITGSLAEVFSGEVFTREIVVKQIPFMFFLLALAIVYISNSYSAEKLKLDIRKMEQEKKVLHQEHVLLKSRLMDYSRKSEVARRLRETGLKESTVPPVKIYANQDGR
jgi:hypothetical protein